MGDAETTDMVGGRYRLLHVIGTGGMGQVWLAEDEVLHRHVAVKEIATEPDTTPAHRTAVREARAAARLDHPGVIAVYDVVQRDGRSWIVMEYVRSRSLHEAIRDDGPLPHSRAARIGLDVLAALRAAHAAGVLHLDVKPHNILLADDGRTVLTDFGLAHIHGNTHDAEPLIGSPHFIAPERLRGEPAGEASDLFSLGATLYAAVEGRPPFHRPTAEATLTTLLTEPPDPPTRRGELTGIIKALLAKEPHARPPAEAVEAALKRAARQAIGIARVARLLTPSTDPAQHPAGKRPAPLPRQGHPVDDPGDLPRPAPPAGRATTRAGRPVAEPRRLARATKVSIAAAALLLVGTTGAALALDLGDPAPAPATTAITIPPPTCAPGGMPAASIPVGSIPAGGTPDGGTRGGDTRGGGVPDGGMPVGGRAEFRGYAVPAGWLWHEDPLGFAVALPQGWTRTAEGGTACFRDPGGGRVLSVDVTARPAPDPRSVWTAAESRANLPDYRRTSIGARWDFTWQPPGDPVRRHERRQLAERPDGRAYLVGWATSEPDWAAGEAALTLALTSLS